LNTRAVTKFSGRYFVSNLITKFEYETLLQFPAGAIMGYFLFATASRPALRTTQPPIRRVPRALTPR